MDEGRVTALTLLDLSAAFDTLDHSRITNLLVTWYGIDGIALDWFVSYLSDRKQKVKLMDCLSSPAEVACGVPQKSVLGALLFVTRHARRYLPAAFLELFMTSFKI